MERICFLSPNVEHAQQAIGVLRALGVPDKHLYVVARHGETFEGLPDAGPEDDDFLPAYERGVAFGGVGGLLAGLYALAFPPAGIVIGGGAVLLVTLFGAGFGGVLAGLAGAAFPSSRLAEFEEAIEAGSLLIMADVPKTEVINCKAKVRQVDPAIKLFGFEPPAPIVP